MRITHAVLVFSVLISATASLNLRYGRCSLNKEYGIDCPTVKDVHTLHNVSNLNSLKVPITLKEIPKGTFRSFSNLTHLDLSNGTLNRVEPDDFLHLIKLQFLNLADNQIKVIRLGAFNSLKRLISLNLRNNAIRQLSPEILNLKSLQFIDIVGNPLECNCATLRIRDALLKRHVKFPKRTLCAGPGGVKGLFLSKPETNLVCLLDKTEKDMQMDQPTFEDEEGSGDYNEEYDEDYKSIEEPKQKEIDKLMPSKASEKTNSSTGEEIFFDSEDSDKKTKNATQGHEESTEGSSDVDDEGSGLEGSGMDLLPHIDWKQIQEETIEETSTAASEPSSTTHSESLFDIILNALWTTTAPEEKKIPELEEEQFIHVNTETTATDKVEPRSGIDEAIAVPATKLPEAKPTKESEKLVNSAEDRNEKLNESLSNQSKRGTGSYIVLAALLVVLAGLIAFAAYKGDFCRSKQKGGNVEDGTELKDMQKSLLEQNNVPKVTSNGNTEIVPLMAKDDDKNPENGNSKREDMVDGSDPVKPPRKSMSLDDKMMTNGTNHHEQVANHSDVKPPVSPGAQRVKITMQDNPDSVPKTPVFITRSKPDDNLVKAP